MTLRWARRVEARSGGTNPPRHQASSAGQILPGAPPGGDLTVPRAARLLATLASAPRDPSNLDVPPAGAQTRFRFDQLDFERGRKPAAVGSAA